MCSQMDHRIGTLQRRHPGARLPQVRRFHNGQWGAVFGNGLGSASGDGGIYVMTVDQDDAKITFYYLSTAIGSSNVNACVGKSRYSSASSKLFSRYCICPFASGCIHPS